MPAYVWELQVCSDHSWRRQMYWWTTKVLFFSYQTVRPRPTLCQQKSGLLINNIHSRGGVSEKHTRNTNITWCVRALARIQDLRFFFYDQLQNCIFELHIKNQKRHQLESRKTQNFELLRARHLSAQPLQPLCSISYQTPSLTLPLRQVECIQEARLICYELWFVGDKFATQ